jgi:hypothetical protein
MRVDAFRCVEEVQMSDLEPQVQNQHELNKHESLRHSENSLAA